MAASPSSKNQTAIHLWLIFFKAFRAISSHATQSLKPSELGDSEFRVLEVLLHKGPLPVNTIGPKVWLTPGSISVAVERLVQRKLVARTGTAGDRRVRQVALTPKGRALIRETFQEHTEAMEHALSALNGKERAMLLALLKKVGKHAEACPYLRGDDRGAAPAP